MKTTRFTQAGIGHVVILFVIVFVAVVGFAGWKVATMNKGAATDMRCITLLVTSECLH